LSIKVLILSDLFERDVSRLVSEINENISLKRLLGNLIPRVKADESIQNAVKSRLRIDFHVFLKIISA